MADQPLDPETDERVRRLLADARHDAPMPAEVADRMDRVLAGLAGEPATRHKVVRLADRRRRAASLLVAAAAVVAAGVGIGQLVQPGSSGSGASADRAAVAPEQAPSGAEPESSGAGADSGSTDLKSVPSPQSYFDAASAYKLRPQHFSRDVVEARKAVAGDIPLNGVSSDGIRAPAEPCTRPSWGGGRYVPVRYGAVEGYLVFRKPTGDTQVVDLYLCGARIAVRSVTLPRP